jgi:hypothetical protein
MRFPGFFRRLVQFAGGVGTDTISEVTSAAGVTVDGCLIKDGAVAKVASAATFVSSEITGNGSAQAAAHGLAATPTKFFAFFTELDGNAADIGTLTADATNVTVTVTTGQKYRIYATL